ncbi:MAG: PF20097 family protein [Rubricoccaceae bacterium]|nr:PF20097 family protein [Rubricoccaceae bacterium]
MAETPWHRTCIRCGGEMEEGYLLDETHGGYRTTRWVEGAAEKSIWTGLKTKGRRKLPLTAYRCVQCGAVDLYAPTSEDP